jgi:parvulin-like peptidyl-prolyl isomerase
MFRRLLAVIVVALLAASCSHSDVLATVNGEEITKDDLYVVYPDWEDPNALTGEELRQAVSNLVTFEAITQAAEREYAVVLDEATIAERVANPPSRYESILVPELMSGSANDEIIRLNAIQSLLVDAVGPDLMADQYGGYEGWIESRPETVSRVCLRYIYVETSEDAEAVLARLSAGEDFIDLVAEVSIDQTAPDGLITNDGGGCLIDLSLFTEEIINAAIDTELNEPVGPVPIGTGFGVIRIEDRVIPSAVQLRADPMEYADSATIEALYSGWTSDVVRDADVSVSATVGTWSPAGFGIAPPSS